MQGHLIKGFLWLLCWFWICRSPLFWQPPLCSALFCIFESFACKPCSLVLSALWRGGGESPTSIVLMSKLERRRFETLLVFRLKIKIV